jgi:hypothetical protein
LAAFFVVPGCFGLCGAAFLATTLLGAAFFAGAFFAGAFLAVAINFSSVEFRASRSSLAVAADTA